jgi:fatty-acid desaturase
MLLILAFIVILALIDPNLIFYIWALPVFGVSITQIAFNYFCHMHGYRNFATKDKSTNNMFMWPFILGDAWHNNHHKHAGQVNTKVRHYEFDPVYMLINVIRSDN